MLNYKLREGALLCLIYIIVLKIIASQAAESLTQVLVSILKGTLNTVRFVEVH